MSIDKTQIYGMTTLVVEGETINVLGQSFHICRPKGGGSIRDRFPENPPPLSKVLDIYTNNHTCIMHTFEQKGKIYIIGSSAFEK